MTIQKNPSVEFLRAFRGFEGIECLDNGSCVVGFSINNATRNEPVAYRVFFFNVSDRRFNVVCDSAFPVIKDISITQETAGTWKVAFIFENGSIAFNYETAVVQTRPVTVIRGQSR